MAHLCMPLPQFQQAAAACSPCPPLWAPTRLLLLLLKLGPDGIELFLLGRQLILAGLHRLQHLERSVLQALKLLHPASQPAGLRRFI